MTTARDLAERLQGTCDHLDMDDHPGFTAADWAQLDSLVFCCEGCGWWFEVGEESEVAAGYCDGCYPTCENCGGDPDECGCDEPEEEEPCPRDRDYDHCCGYPDDCTEEGED